MHTYIAQKGESARSVSEKFNVTPAALMRENVTPFYEGQVVTVPVGVLNLPSHSAPVHPAAYYQVPESSVFTRRDRVNIVFL